MKLCLLVMVYWVLDVSDAVSAAFVRSVIVSVGDDVAFVGIVIMFIGDIGRHMPRACFIDSLHTCCPSKTC